MTDAPTFDQSVVTDFSAGKPIDTNNPYDLAIMGDGFFAVRADDRILYTRQGQFHRDADGRLVTAAGHVLQADGGGDVKLRGDGFKLTSDGIVLEDGVPGAELGLVDFKDRKQMNPAEGGLFSAPDAEAVKVEAPAIRQGMLESSNVSTADEMISIMEALRRAEAGQKLINVYDDLMGRALTTFGQV